MDIVTAGRACLRRFYVFIPVVVIGVLASIHVANATKPTYEATGSFLVLNNAVQVVPVKPSASSTKSRDAGKSASSDSTGSASASSPATSSPTPQPTQSVETSNPFAGSQDLLRAALISSLNSPEFRGTLSKAGHKGSFSVALAKKQPVFDVTADARRRPQAIDLVNAVLARVNGETAAVQRSAGAPADTLFRAQTLVKASGASDTTSGKSKRLIAGVVVSVAAALALSIGLDSLVLSLRRRRAGRAADGDTTVTEPISDADGARLPRRTPPSDEHDPEVGVSSETLTGRGRHEL